MLYFSVLAIVGFAAAAAFRWPVMFGAAVLVSIAASIADRSMHASIGHSVLEAVASLLVVQIAYVIGGALFGLRLRRSEARKNLRV